MAEETSSAVNDKSAKTNSPDHKETSLESTSPQPDTFKRPAEVSQEDGNGEKLQPKERSSEPAAGVKRPISEVGDEGKPDVKKIKPDTKQRSPSNELEEGEMSESSTRDTSLPPESNRTSPRPSAHHKSRAAPDVRRPSPPPEFLELFKSPPTPYLSPNFHDVDVPLSQALSAYTGTSDISEFESSKKVGEGTFGEVTIAKHKSTGRKVALKKIILHKDRDGLPITAVREIAILKSLRHPNLINLEEIAVRRGDRRAEEVATLFMVFPYMKHDLSGLLDNPQVTFDPSHIKSFTKQMLDGILYLHQRNILHRDMKSANILIDNGGNLRIADFGLARSFDPSAGRRLTPTVVTLWYRAPELLLGKQDYTAAVDMWGIGCIFAEMWDRRPIFKGATEVELIEKIFSICGTPDPADYRSSNGKRQGKFPKLEDGTVTPQPQPRRIWDAYSSERLDFQTIAFIDYLLNLDPDRRPTADEALRHDYFLVEPRAAEPNTSDFPTWEESHEYGMRLRHEQAARAFNERANLSRMIPGLAPLEHLPPPLPVHSDAFRLRSGKVVRRRRLADVGMSGRGGDRLDRYNSGIRDERDDWNGDRSSRYGNRADSVGKDERWQKGGHDRYVPGGESGGRDDRTERESHAASSVKDDRGRRSGHDHYSVTSETSGRGDRERSTKDDRGRGRDVYIPNHEAREERSHRNAKNEEPILKPAQGHRTPSDRQSHRERAREGRKREEESRDTPEQRAVEKNADEKERDVNGSHGMLDNRYLDRKADDKRKGMYHERHNQKDREVDKMSDEKQKDEEQKHDKGNSRNGDKVSDPNRKSEGSKHDKREDRGAIDKRPDDKRGDEDHKSSKPDDREGTKTDIGRKSEEHKHDTRDYCRETDKRSDDKRRDEDHKSSKRDDREGTKADGGRKSEDHKHDKRDDRALVDKKSDHTRTDKEHHNNKRDDREGRRIHDSRRKSDDHKRDKRDNHMVLDKKSDEKKAAGKVDAKSEEKQRDSVVYDRRSPGVHKPRDKDQTEYKGDEGHSKSDRRSVAASQGQKEDDSGGQRRDVRNHGTPEKTSEREVKRTESRTGDQGRGDRRDNRHGDADLPISERPKLHRASSGDAKRQSAREQPRGGRESIKMETKSDFLDSNKEEESQRSTTRKEEASEPDIHRSTAKVRISEKKDEPKSSSRDPSTENKLGTRESGSDKRKRDDEPDHPTKRRSLDNEDLIGKREERKEETKSGTRSDEKRLDDPKSPSVTRKSAKDVKHDTSPRLRETKLEDDAKKIRESKDDGSSRSRRTSFGDDRKQRESKDHFPSRTRRTGLEEDDNQRKESKDDDSARSRRTSLEDDPTKEKGFNDHRSSRSRRDTLEDDGRRDKESKDHHPSPSRRTHLEDEGRRGKDVWRKESSRSSRRTSLESDTHKTTDARREERKWETSSTRETKTDNLSAKGKDSRSMNQPGSERDKRKDSHDQESLSPSRKPRKSESETPRRMKRSAEEDERSVKRRHPLPPRPKDSPGRRKE
ncbi:CMGC/CDK protein kinase [Spizellomyces punctatus DAOM BR117]|uniref:CMGC/CDK protein kinase n=1 Tax=Spizellomyces punctatus (strain DAOM BR117) TaxID=645134 RepID=A0A0L0HPY6_SPIPD|nr:CMGC/CDK protein kinase [Spizellomyces punctatus DAOM BR117]KND03491.1 CMGC/CDK protein kinase [Spizellomyces punctatus DAOM BR117]|eukprot:XP_016611530.1 CMGC/CDK protein kinase [Spizellomyces punctatus DAOM BR117]